MRTKNELYQEALRTVAARRQMARARAEDARAEAEAAVPALRHAEDEVRVRGLRCALAGASGKDRTEAAAALADARQKLTALLAASGRPADALEPKFSCKLCQDTGTVNGHTCSCVHKVMQQLRRQEIEQLSSLSISSFDTMELRYYPNTMDAQNGVNVRAYMGRLLDGLKPVSYTHLDVYKRQPLHRAPPPVQRPAPAFRPAARCAGCRRHRSVH